MKTIIHINQHNIKHNAKCEVLDRKEVITCKTYKENIYTNSLQIVDDNGKVIAVIKYSPDKPLSCGAKVFILTDSNNVRITA